MHNKGLAVTTSLDPDWRDLFSGPRALEDPALEPSLPPAHRICGAEEKAPQPPVRHVWAPETGIPGPNGHESASKPSSPSSSSLSSSSREWTAPLSEPTWWPSGRFLQKAWAELECAGPGSTCFGEGPSGGRQSRAWERRGHFPHSSSSRQRTPWTSSL